MEETIGVVYDMTESDCEGTNGDTGEFRSFADVFAPVVVLAGNDSTGSLGVLDLVEVDVTFVLVVPVVVFTWCNVSGDIGELG